MNGLSQKKPEPNQIWQTSKKFSQMKRGNHNLTMEIGPQSLRDGFMMYTLAVFWKNESGFIPYPNIECNQKGENVTTIVDILCKHSYLVASSKPCKWILHLWVRFCKFFFF